MIQINDGLHAPGSPLDVTARRACRMPTEAIVALGAILAVFAAFMAVVAYIDSLFWRPKNRNRR